MVAPSNRGRRRACLRPAYAESPAQFAKYVALTQVHLHLSQRAVFEESGSCFGDSGGPIFGGAHPDGNEIIVAW